MTKFFLLPANLARKCSVMLRNPFHAHVSKSTVPPSLNREPGGMGRRSRVEYGYSGRYESAVMPLRERSAVTREHV